MNHRNNGIPHLCIDIKTEQKIAMNKQKHAAHMPFVYI